MEKFHFFKCNFPKFSKKKVVEFHWFSWNFPTLFNRFVIMRFPQNRKSELLSYNIDVIPFKEMENFAWKNAWKKFRNFCTFFMFI